MNAWLVALGMLVVAVLSFWLLHDLGGANGVPTPRNAHRPDYYIQNMVRTTTGPGGEIRNVLRSPLVTHYPDDDSTELATPRLEIYNGRVEPWHVIAQRGWISSGNDVVLLHGPVEIWQLGAGGTRRYQVLTSELRVLPKEQYAETDNPATIIGPFSVTHTIGMRANFAHNRLELLERVRTRYEVKPQT